TQLSGRYIAAVHCSPSFQSFTSPSCSLCCCAICNRFSFFNYTPTTEIYTLSLHDALPISRRPPPYSSAWISTSAALARPRSRGRSEEHTSELQSRENLVCRLLLEKKKKNYHHSTAASTAS